MPFVKRVNSRITRPSGEMRKIFIGRTTELQFFVEHILKPDDPSYNIISISGEGGVGKSTLLARFIEEARSSDFRDFCLTALVDESQMTPYSVMENFAQQLSEAGAPLIEFERGLTRYKETVKKLHIQKEAAQETAIREAVDFVGTIVEEVPVVGGVLQKTANMATELYLKDHQIRQMLKDSTLLENPIRDLTKVFIEELNQLSDKQILLGHNRIKRQQRFILFFDTFEQLSTEIAPWLIDYFLPSNISTNIVLVIASRDSIEHSMPNDPKRWLPYRNQGILHLINLNSFTEDETRAYLAKQGIIEPQNVTTIWQLSKGLPLYLGLLTFNLESSIDPTADVVANFLRWIPENEIIKHKLVLDIALFSKPFNQDDLIAFTYLPENEIDMLYLWLIRLPFIRNSHQDGRYRYHELAQEMFRRHLYQRSQEEYYATRRALSAYYQRLLNNMLDQVGKRAYMFAEFVEIALASAYQLCYLPDEASHATSIELITNVYRYTNAEMKRESLKFLRDLPSEQQNTKINFTGLSFAKQLLLVLEAHIENKYKNLIEATNELIKNASRKPLFSPPFFRWIYNIRGIAYHDLKEYQRAIEDYTQAITLNPTDAVYNNRGIAYGNLKEYRRAIEDFDQAITLNPTYAAIYNSRGSIYGNLKEYRRAIEDFDQAITLNPTYTAAYYNRGITYGNLSEYQQAIEDFSQAITLNPTHTAAYNNRGITYGSLKEYQRAIEDFTQAITLNPTYALAYNSRGIAYDDLKEYQRAIEDYTQAITLNPTYAAAYNNRGITYRNLSEYQQAIEDFTQAITLNPTYTAAYYNRGIAYGSLKEYQRAIEDFTQAITLNPTYTAAYNNRGIAYRNLKEYQRAIEDFTQAINLNPEYTSGYVARSEAFRLIGKYEDALSDLNCISEFDKSINADPFNNKGLILSYLKRYEEAIENYNEGLKKAPNTINLLYNMAVSMMRLHGLSIAKSHINIAYDALLALKDNETQHIKFYGLGGLAALTGETDQALDYLQKAIPLDEDVIGWARHDMAWIDLHSNPCFQALIK